MTDRELLALGRHVREREDQLLSASDGSEATRRHLAEYVGQQRSQRPAAHEHAALGHWSRRWLRVAGGPGTRRAWAAAAGLAVCFFAASALWRPALTFRVGASERVGVLSELELAPPGASLPIRFSDGTVVNLDSEARARVVALGSSGAEIVIESGRAELDVVPVRGRAAAQRPWRVKTGPFSVEVKGTRFDVRWDARTDEFALNLYEGSVLVKGCGRDLGETIVAGQGVRASCARQQWSVVALEPAPPAAARAAPSTAAESPPNERHGLDAAEPAAAPVAPASPREPRERPGPSWQQLGRAGHFREAFERASSRGFSAECERSSAIDLLLLGDAARLAGESERARQAYSALRRRFPDDAAAPRAAFALGRLSVDAEPRSAARWFDVCLREQPEGPLAQAALERLLELTSLLDDHEWQRQVATAYLARYPQGPHARAAAVILERATPEH